MKRHYKHGDRVMLVGGPTGLRGAFGSVMGVFNQLGIKNPLPGPVDWKTQTCVVWDCGVGPSIVDLDAIEPAKMCKICKEERGFSQFHDHQTNADGKENRCTVKCSPVTHSINYHLKKRHDEELKKGEF